MRDVGRRIAVVATVTILAGTAWARVEASGSTKTPAAGGDPLWVARYVGPGEYDQAQAVGVSPDGTTVFVTGYSERAPGASYDYATAAYEATTGAELWTRRYDGPGHFFDWGTALAVSPDGSKVFVTGYSVGVGSGRDYATLAYEAPTGVLLWTARYSGPGARSDEAFAIASSPDGSKVFVTGSVKTASTDDDFATVAYDASTGTALWGRRYDGPGHGGDTGAALAVAPDGSRLIVAGSSLGTTGLTDYATVAYDTSTGARLWGKRYDGPGHDNDFAESVAVSPDGSKAFVTGWSYDLSYDYATLAFDSGTGAVLWTSRYDGPGVNDDQAESVVSSIDGSMVFVTGRSKGVTTSYDFATLAYRVADGGLVWGKRYAGAGGGNGDLAFAAAVTPDGQAVIVTGSSDIPPTAFPDFATIRYAASTGSMEWISLYNGPAHRFDEAYSLALSPDGSMAFVSGLSDGAVADPDYATVAIET